MKEKGNKNIENKAGDTTQHDTEIRKMLENIYTNNNKSGLNENYEKTSFTRQSKFPIEKQKLIELDHFIHEKKIPIPMTPQQVESFLDVDFKKETQFDYTKDKELIEITTTKGEKKKISPVRRIQWRVLLPRFKTNKIKLMVNIARDNNDNRIFLFTPLDNPYGSKE